MRKRWIKLAVVLLLILLPVMIGAIYRHTTRIPAEILIAAGSPGGAFNPLATRLAAALEARLRLRGHEVKVKTRSTEGSFENLQLLQAEKVHFGLYQPGTHQLLAKRVFEGLDKTGDGALTLSEFQAAQPEEAGPGVTASSRSISFYRSDNDPDD